MDILLPTNISGITGWAYTADLEHISQSEGQITYDNLSFVLRTVEVSIFCSGFLRKSLPAPLLGHWNAASAKNIILSLFYVPFPNVHQFGGTFPCQLFFPNYLTGELLNETISKNKASGGREEEFLTVSRSEDLRRSISPMLQSSNPDIWPWGLELRMFLFPPSSTLQCARAVVVFMNPL